MIVGSWYIKWFWNSYQGKKYRGDIFWRVLSLKSNLLNLPFRGKIRSNCNGRSRIQSFTERFSLLKKQSNLNDSIKGRGQAGCIQFRTWILKHLDLWRKELKFIFLALFFQGHIWNQRWNWKFHFALPEIPF